MDDKFKILQQSYSKNDMIHRLFTQKDFLKIIEKYPIYAMTRFNLIKYVKGYKKILKKLYSEKKIDINCVSKKEIEKYPNLIYLINLDTFDLSKIPYNNYYIQKNLNYNNHRLIQYLNTIKMTYLAIGKKNWKKNFDKMDKDALIKYNYQIFYNNKKLFNKLNEKEQKELLNFTPFVVQCKFTTSGDIQRFISNNPNSGIFSYQLDSSFFKKILKDKKIEDFIAEKGFYTAILYNKDIKLTNQLIIENFKLNPIGSFIQSKENTLTEREYKILEDCFLQAKDDIKHFFTFENYSLLYYRFEMETNFPFEKLLNIINHYRDNVNFVNVLKSLPYYKNEAQLIKHFIDG